MKKIVHILIFSLLVTGIYAQKENADMRDGNKLYKSGKFTEAEIAYRKGLSKNPKSFEANYNLGNALFKQKKYPEALEQYKSALELKPSEKNKMAAAFHNIGNSLFVGSKFEESIEAYKMALKNNPQDNETRYNLAYAQLMLKNQQKQNNGKDNDKNKDDKESPIKKKADELIAQRKYQEAYDLMKEWEKKDKRLLQYSDFTNRILDVIKLK
ncbi:MAG TPA: tetratricopeptide repeat protein [Paludibacter sp.]|nr:tetratricopeptide repeat protein [Paludibacter sp.]